MSKKSKTDLFAELAKICEQLGWSIAIDSEDNVNGAIIGSLEYIQDIALQLDNAEEFELFTIEGTGPSKGENIH